MPPADVIATLAAYLQQAGAREQQLVHWHSVPARPGQCAPWPQWVHPQVVAALTTAGVQSLWQHQAEAVDAVAAGRHVVVATGTGSGKSLVGWLPVLSALTAAAETSGSVAAWRCRPTALYLAPTKALAADQLASLQRLIAAGGLPVAAETCDGDTDAQARAWVRAHADIVLTNPDFLHHSLLPGQRRWQRLLRQLRVVIVDECHSYRGVFGAHVALVLRRLLRLARRAGANPTVVCASATVAEPAASAARLLGVSPTEIVPITRDTSPRGAQLVALWQPSIARPAGAGTSPAAAAESPAGQVTRISATSEAARLAARFTHLGAQSLVFVRSRAAAETVSETVQRWLAAAAPRPSDGPPGGPLREPGAVAAYRGGYLPEERRALEAALRAGQLRALATTSALELGIDINGLDAVITAGWPGSRSSLRQQAGRAGRAGARGLAVFVAGADPLDQYLLHHPEAFLADVEATVFDPGNWHVLAPHLCAAAAEAPLTREDYRLFDLPDSTLLHELAAAGLLRARPGGWYWNYSQPTRPSALTDLRGAAHTLPIVRADTGVVVGQASAGTRADATLHPGALYLHQGQLYLVVELHDDYVLVRPTAEPGWRTRARSRTSIDILEPTATAAASAGGQWHTGKVAVREQVTHYDRRQVPDGQILSAHPLELPERSLTTTAVWWTVSSDEWQRLGLTEAQLPGALHAAEHAAIAMLPLLATCDRWDLGGLSTAWHPQTGQATIFVHDALPGGAGFAARGFAARHEWMQATADLVASCPCQAGCPSCIQSPKCGNGNEPLDKEAAARLLRAFARATAPATQPSDAAETNKGRERGGGT
ncbi:DEAD/DEAH box helicase [Buchananella hordeovulneris]|uniref:DEAD/DEAH box helicase n=1 Tax=Buchananella hordeovulneris TaxID=52770 RepID=A0A1Q5PUQ0_9ACTO|nr:DEAD/DEAH box helicase [Buchananella hordeovulneris]OKL51333.1 hypothetical protein BSZ40_08490 [Buchananella hordeovulneris]